MSNSRIYSHLISTTTGMQRLAPPVVAATVTRLCWEGIQLARPLSDPFHESTKGAIKDQFSTISSYVSAFAILVCAIDFASTFLPNTKKLTRSQQIAIASMGFVALAGACYGDYDFGLEHTTASRGYTAAASAALFQCASATAAHYVKKHDENEELHRFAVVSV